MNKNTFNQMLASLKELKPTPSIQNEPSRSDSEILVPQIETTNELLGKLIALHSQDRGTDVPSDQLMQRYVNILNGVAGTFDVPTETDYTWYLVYNAPTSGSVGLGPVMGKPIGKFAVGSTFWGRVPRGSILTINYDAPTADGQFTVYLSTRPLDFNYTTPNGILVDEPFVFATSGGLAVTIRDNATAGSQATVAANNADAASSNGQGLVTKAFGYGYNGLTFDRVRIPNVYKPTTVAFAVNPAATLWTPAAGKKFRLMGIAYAMPVGASLELRDGAAGPVVAMLPGGTGSFTVDFGQGILSSTINNVLQAFGATAASTITGTVWGTEE